MPVTICQSPNCITEAKNGSRPCVDPTVTYTGAVLATYERNGYDDSDFYAIVWDEPTGTVKDICYASTRGWTYHNGAKVDATDEVKTKAGRVAADTLAQTLIATAREQAARPAVGLTVRSTTIRGKNVGVVGEVRWIGDGQYGPRVGLRIDGSDKLRYLDANRVEAIDPPDVDEAELRRVAAARVAGGQWRVSF